MSQIIDQTRLKALRADRGLSQAQLARKAKLNKQTMYRIEAGEHRHVRSRTVENIAKALAVDPKVLTGELPMPESDAKATQPTPDTGDYVINVPVDGAIRNAFTLAALRYRMPIARIVELAPYLFVVAAEASLERRKKILKLLRKHSTRFGMRQ